MGLLKLYFANLVHSGSPGGVYNAQDNGGLVSAGKREEQQNIFWLGQ